MDQRARFVEYIGPSSLQLREVDLPQVGIDDLILKVALCGVDGSEVHMYRGELEWVNELAPLIFGDEIVGTVEAIGTRAADERGLAVGDRVALEARWPCNNCEPCLNKQYYLCDHYGIISGYGATSSKDAPYLWGGYSTHVFVPREALIYKIPETMEYRSALIASSPLPNGIRWVTEADCKRDDHIVVIGPGAQGLCCALAASSIGGRVTLVGLQSDKDRLEMGRRLGAHEVVVVPDGEHSSDTAARILGGIGPADIVLDVAGAISAKNIGMGVLKKMGTFVNVAISSPAKQEVNWVELLAKEIKLLSFASHPHAVPAGFELGLSLKEQGIELGELITHTYPLQDAETAIAAAAYELDERPIKVAIDLSL